MYHALSRCVTAAQSVIRVTRPAAAYNNVAFRPVLSSAARWQQTNRMFSTKHEEDDDAFDEEDDDAFDDENDVTHEKTEKPKVRSSFFLSSTVIILCEQLTHMHLLFH
jgi:hypothetical protein